MGSGPSINVNVRLSPELHQRVKQEGAVRRMGVSELIREALLYYLVEEEE